MYPVSFFVYSYEIISGGGSGAISTVVVVVVNGKIACSDFPSTGRHWATLNVTMYTFIAENLKKIKHNFFFVHETL